MERFAICTPWTSPSCPLEENQWRCTAHLFSHYLHGGHNTNQWVRSPCKTISLLNKCRLFKICFYENLKIKIAIFLFSVLYNYVNTSQYARNDNTMIVFLHSFQKKKNWPFLSIVILHSFPSFLFKIKNQSTVSAAKL